jgi:hypothetical protein
MTTPHYGFSSFTAPLLLVLCGFSRLLLPATVLTAAAASANTWFYGCAAFLATFLPLPTFAAAPPFAPRYIRNRDKVVDNIAFQIMSCFLQNALIIQCLYRYMSLLSFSTPLFDFKMVSI